MWNVSKTRCFSLGVVAAAVLMLAAGCKANSTSPAGAGGANGSGGTNGSGGVSSSGGKSGSGGSGSGGTSEAGGTGGFGGSGSAGSGSGGTGGSGGEPEAGGASGAGGEPETGGATGSGGTADQGGASGAGGSTSGAAVICKPKSTVVNDFSDSECGYGGWGDGEMNSSAWASANGTSSISATCADGSWTFSGTLGVTSDTGDNWAGFGISLLGYVHDNTADSNWDCTAFDLSAYSGFSITLSSASGAISTIGIGVNLADESKGEKKISVPTTPTPVSVTWSDLGISDASRIATIWGYFVNGSSDVTVDLVIEGFSLD
jgi:hypothetical protein